MYLHSRILLLLSILAALIPTVLFAQSAYTCDCAADTLNCSDFASPADAQACFWYCGAQGVGDIHRLDLDMNAVACDVIAQPSAPSTPEPVYIEPAPTLEPVYIMPTAVPAYEVCSCGGDYYDCSTFSGPSHAQGCYDYCTAQGLGDVHQMDPDGDGLACLVSGAVSTVPMSVAPTATSIPYIPPTAAYVAPMPTVTSTPYIPPTVAFVDVAPAPTITPTPYIPPMPTSVYVVPTLVPTVYVAPTMEPAMVAVPTSTPFPYIPGLDINGKVANPNVCACDADYYNCSSFASGMDAQTCFNYCVSQGAGDIHRLDQGGVEQVTCEQHSWLDTTTSEPIFESVVEFAGDSCTVCVEDRYNCSDFSTAGLAQGCFDACRSMGYGDIHGLDRDGDLSVCESRPRNP